MKCECGGSLVLLETYCTKPYQKSLTWFRDVKQRYVCSVCGKERARTIDTIKQAKQFK